MERAQLEAGRLAHVGLCEGVERAVEACKDLGRRVAPVSSHVVGKVRSQQVDVASLGLARPLGRVRLPQQQAARRFERVRRQAAIGRRRGAHGAGSGAPVEGGAQSAQVAEEQKVFVTPQPGGRKALAGEPLRAGVLVGREESHRREGGQALHVGVAKLSASDDHRGEALRGPLRRSRQALDDSGAGVDREAFKVVQ